ncbi:hypothetical protein CL684_00595 [Candidatus Campbellbacteria bacterium]|nr:hypothetical protein [Candidatus Campbellbacteria bacterium]|tara:strand:+ start:378 stop:1025 length:648 start_codon:yes stop_codon:yes gene_type:complete
MKKENIPPMDIQEWLLFIFWINHLPVFLVSVGALMVVAGIVGTSTYTHIVTIFALILLFGTPFTSRKPISIFRKLLTMSVGFILLIAYLAPGWWIHHGMLVSIGLGGMYFFGHDFRKMLKKYRTIRKQRDIKWFFDERLHKKYLNSKCSRQVFLRSALLLNPKKGKLLYKIVRRKTGSRWFNFFPDSPVPLLGLLLPKPWKWIEEKLHKYGIKTY